MRSKRQEDRVEALVCQDKLAGCQGKTSWVSGKLQYADGLAKQSGEGVVPSVSGPVGPSGPLACQGPSAVSVQGYLSTR